MARVNKNENPLRQAKQLAGEISWVNYSQAHIFTHLCTLSPNRNQERLDLKAIHAAADMKRRGVVYVMVIHGRILKIGQSIGTFESRLGSYNTGKVAYRSRGTNSGANFFILQSILNINKEVEVYAFFPPQQKWQMLGATGKEAFPSAKVAEKIVIRHFRENYGKLPIGNAQN